MIKQFLAVQLFDSRKKLKHFDKPTLVVTGDNDMIIGSHHSKTLSSLLPQARLHLVKGGTHAMLDADAEELARVYIEFLLDEG